MKVLVELEQQAYGLLAPPRKQATAEGSLVKKTIMAPKVKAIALPPPREYSHPSPGKSAMSKRLEVQVNMDVGKAEAAPQGKLKICDGSLKQRRRV